MMNLGFVSNVTKICPFQTLNNKTFNLYVSDCNIQKDYGKDYSCKLVHKLRPNLNSLLNQFNDSSQTHILKFLKMLSRENITI